MGTVLQWAITIVALLALLIITGNVMQHTHPMFLRVVTAISVVATVVHMVLVTFFSVHNLTYDIVMVAVVTLLGIGTAGFFTRRDPFFAGALLCLFMIVIGYSVIVVKGRETLVQPILAYSLVGIGLAFFVVLAILRSRRNKQGARA